LLQTYFKVQSEPSIFYIILKVRTPLSQTSLSTNVHFRIHIDPAITMSINHALQPQIISRNLLSTTIEKGGHYCVTNKMDHNCITFIKLDCWLQAGPIDQTIFVRRRHQPMMYPLITASTIPKGSKYVNTAVASTSDSSDNDDSFASTYFDDTALNMPHVEITETINSV